MADSPGPEARTHEFAEVTRSEVAPAQRLSIEDLRNIRLDICTELGQRTMLVRDVLDMRRGSVVPLNKLAGETADIYVNNLPLARGEIMVIGDSLAVRIVDIVGAVKKDGDTAGEM